jgi:hypothetical protein
MIRLNKRLENIHGYICIGLISEDKIGCSAVEAGLTE